MRLSLLLLTAPLALGAQGAPRWKAHDPERPKPTMVTPGSAVGQPPSDAVVLFNGTSLDAWSDEKGGPPGWVLRDGYMETAPGAGAIQTRRGLGDMQLHLEWASPSRVEGRGQGRGNSGVIIMGRYEVQVLDSYGNETYADGQAAAIYGQYPPQVNASRPPGEWQSYDIIFRRPHFGPGGRVTRPATLTVFHNGVLVHDRVTLWGETNWLQYVPYAAHPDSLPLVLQDHANPVRYRNIWYRPLPPEVYPADLAVSRPQVNLPAATLREYEGKYVAGGNEMATVIGRGKALVLSLPGTPRRELTLVPTGRDQFALLRTAGRVEFERREGRVARIHFLFAEQDRWGDRQ